MIQEQDFELNLDLDGVLADYTRGVRESFGITYPKTRIPDEEFAAFHSDLYEKINATGGAFWSNLRPTVDAWRLFSAVKDYSPRIITAFPSETSTDLEKKCCRIGKRIWVKDVLNIPADRVHVCHARDKHTFVNPKVKSILIDDNKQNIEDWNAAGGYGILHTSAVSSIYKLNQIFKL